MIVLGIETATLVSSVALGSERGPIAAKLIARGRGHVEFLTPAIRELCEESEVPLRSVGGIAVDLGPGLFTGMRVGIQTAKSLAQMLHVPIVGIASLDVLAFGVRYSRRLICACVDARRGEVFCAFYRQVPDGVQREGDLQAWTPEALAAEIVARAEDVLVVGDGADAYGEQLGSLGNVELASVGDRYPTAANLVELAVPRLLREEGSPVARIEPLYVRRSDAEIKWETRGVTIERPDRVKIPKRAAEGGAR